MTYLEQFDAAEDSAKADLIGEWIGTAAHDFFAELRRDRPILQAPAPGTRWSKEKDRGRSPSLHSRAPAAKSVSRRIIGGRFAAGA